MKRTVLIIGLSLALCLLVCPAFAADLLVCTGHGHGRGHGPACQYATIQAAVDAANPGDTIMVGPGAWYGATVNKSVEIKGMFGAVINDGPINMSPPDTTAAATGFILAAGSDGAKISHFRFEQPLVWGVLGFQANDVSVTLCTFTKLACGISIIDGSDWTVTHNQIYDPQWILLNTGPSHAGGILLQVRLAAETCTGNVIAYNTIEGTWDVPNDSNGNPVLTPASPTAAAFGIGLAIKTLDGGSNTSPGYLIASNLFLSNRIDIALAARWATPGGTYSPPTRRAFLYRDLLTNANSTDPNYLASVFPIHGNMIALNQLPGFTNDSCGGPACNGHALNTNLPNPAAAALFSQNGFIPDRPNDWPIWW